MLSTSRTRYYKGINLMIFDLKTIVKNFKKPITGVVHVGAFIGEEIDSYLELDIENAAFFEPQKHLYEIVERKCRTTTKNYQAYNCGIGSEELTIPMHISCTEGGIQNGSGASSSFLKPKVHLQEHPHITFNETIVAEVKILDSFNFGQAYNMLNIDVQGYELQVLKGAKKTLPNIDYIICEVNRDEVYENCPMIDDITIFLSHYNFLLAYVAWQSKSWGDALYVKRS